MGIYVLPGVSTRCREDSSAAFSDAFTGTTRLPGNLRAVFIDYSGFHTSHWTGSAKPVRAQFIGDRIGKSAIKEAAANCSIWFDDFLELSSFRTLRSAIRSAPEKTPRGRKSYLRSALGCLSYLCRIYYAGSMRNESPRFMTQGWRFACVPP